ncbi:MAG: PatG_D domain-containing protein [Methanothrix sp.]|nr:MAG: PatG_D domain-containing protein [Methanothrix sp.]
MKSLPYVYVLGQIEARFPNRSIEKGYVQILERSKSANFEHQQAFYSVLSQPENRYLARKLSWILTKEGVPIYILLPTGPEDLDILLDAIRPSACSLDRQVVVGRKGPVAPPEMCGQEVPMVLVDHLYSLEYNNFMKSIHPELVADEKFKAAALELFRRMMQIADNTGSTEKHRALNYLAVRYLAIYSTAAEKLENSFSLTSAEAIPSRLSDSRKIISVVFSFTNRETGIMEKYFVRVDVTEEFPFIVTKMAPYYDR